MLGLWFGHAALWRLVFGNHVPDDQDLFAGGEPRQFLQLYDDVDLVHDVGAAFDADRLGDLSYPPARRALFKLTLRSGGRKPADASGRSRPAHLPLDDSRGDARSRRLRAGGPVTADQYALLLAGVVTGDGTLGTLHVTAARADEAQLELAAGFVFADHGDTLVAEAEEAGKKAKTLAEHDAEAALFKLIGGDEAGALTLYHAPRPRLAMQMGVGGPVPELRRTCAGIGGREHADARATSGRRAPVAPIHRQQRRRRQFAAASVAVPARATCWRSPAADRSGEQRIVEQVLSDTDVIVASPFVSAIPAGGIGYKRAASDRSVRLTGASTVRVPVAQQGIGPNDVQVVIPAVFFGAQFMAGDVVEFRSPVAGTRSGGPWSR